MQSIFCLHKNFYSTFKYACNELQSTYDTTVSAKFVGLKQAISATHFYQGKLSCLKRTQRQLVVMNKKQTLLESLFQIEEIYCNCIPLFSIRNLWC